MSSPNLKVNPSMSGSIRNQPKNSEVGEPTPSISKQILTPPPPSVTTIINSKEGLQEEHKVLAETDTHQLFGIAPAGLPFSTTGSNNLLAYEWEDTKGQELAKRLPATQLKADRHDVAHLDNLPSKTADAAWTFLQGIPEKEKKKPPASQEIIKSNVKTASPTESEANKAKIIKPKNVKTASPTESEANKAKIIKPKNMKTASPTESEPNKGDSFTFEEWKTWSAQQPPKSKGSQESYTFEEWKTWSKQQARKGDGESSQSKSSYSSSSTGRSGESGQKPDLTKLLTKLPAGTQKEKEVKAVVASLLEIVMPNPKGTQQPKQKVEQKQPKLERTPSKKQAENLIPPVAPNQNDFINFQSYTAPPLQVQNMGANNYYQNFQNYGNQQQFQNDSKQMQIGILPPRTSAFQAPFVPLHDPNYPADGSAPNFIDDGDGLNFSFNPRANFATEVTFTVEPRKKPMWQTMMNCGFTPVIYCSVPPCCLPGNAPPPQCGQQQQQQQYPQQPYQYPQQEEETSSGESSSEESSDDDKGASAPTVVRIGKPRIVHDEKNEFIANPAAGASIARRKSTIKSVKTLASHKSHHSRKISVKSRKSMLGGSLSYDYDDHEHKDSGLHFSESDEDEEYHK